MQLLKLHNLLLTLYPSENLPVEYPTRLLKVCLGKAGGLLDSRPDTGMITNGGGGKRGKKRQRGQEDGLVGGLEGRDARAMSESTGEVILEALKRMSSE
jgi:hypothetical protein